jgi:two-component system, sensor histidine kinase
VEDGAQAISAFQSGAFELVLMDMQMPVMDGLCAVREIRRLEAAQALPRTPVIMLTANALPEHVADTLAAGADRHLAKPITAPMLFEAIAQALSAGAGDEDEDEAAA